MATHIMSRANLKVDIDKMWREMEALKRLAGTGTQDMSPADFHEVEDLLTRIIAHVKEREGL